MSVIQEIVTYKQTELGGFRTNFPVSYQVKIYDRPSNKALALLEGLKAEEASFIFEVKPSSPALGTIQEKPDVEAIVRAYSKHATAISVLTDSKYFGGSFDLLEKCASLTDVPLLCKDFIIDEIQLDWAQMSGATAVLLIVKGLSADKLSELHTKALARGLLPFVEVNDADEVEAALAVNPHVILINNRNLDDLTIDMDNTSRIAPLIPSNVAVISASGISTPKDVKKLRKYASNFLIGSSLMSTPLNELDAKIESLVS